MSALIVGLGNPGSQYDDTRHNIAWNVLDSLSSNRGLFWKDKYKGNLSQCSEGGENFYFLKPQTFMNLSGESVQPAAAFFKIKTEDILVIHDELDLPLGTVAFKSGGGLAGHNGLKSIASRMSSQNFKRLRIGIGRPQRGSVSSFVLSKFSSDEMISLEQIVTGCCKAIDLYMKSGFERAAGKYSRKNLLDGGE